MQLIDIGANLTHESFQHDLPEVLARAHQHGVSQLIVTGASREGSIQALALARTRPGRLHATAGMHPHHAVDYDPATEAELRALALEPEVCAVGEAGLDYFRNLSTPAQQRIAFESQLQIAVDCGKPVFLHQREAHHDFIAILRRYRPRLQAAVVHCFTDQADALDDYLELDCHIGITGWLCDERRGGHLAPLVKRIPGDRLMIETDAPYLLPRTLRPRPKHNRNEPMYLAHICEAVAMARGESTAHVAAITTATARAFFRLGGG
ncbi:TatD family hydrolase [Frateuria aurantia]